MLTREKLVEVLRAGGQFCAADMYTDEAGLAYVLDCSTRTLREWRARGKGPAAKKTSRIVYDLDDVCDWWNRQLVGEANRRRDAEAGGERRPISAAAAKR